MILLVIGHWDLDILFLALVNRQQAAIQQQHDQITGGDINRADIAGPAAVCILFTDDLVVQLVAKRSPLLLALAIYNLRVIQICVVPMAKRLNAAVGSRPAADLPALNRTSKSQ